MTINLLRRVTAAAALTVAAAATAVVVAAPASAAVVSVAGYVWADQPTAASYHPNALYSYNSTGATNTITRMGTGFYEIDFPGLSTLKEGTVNVTPYDPGFCTLDGWAADGSGGESVAIQCDSPEGVAQDMRYTLSYVVRTGSSSLAYAFADHPATRNYTPDRAAQYDGWGGTITIHRSSTGVYQVTVPNAAGTGGTAKVSTISLAGLCHLTSWAAVGADEVIGVTCNSFTNGTPEDSPFTFSFARQANLLGRAASAEAYARADRPTAAHYTPARPDQYNNPNGGLLNAQRTAAGQYAMHIPGQTLVPSDVQVTTYGSTALCSIISWFPNGSGGQNIDVSCVDGTGAGTDTQYVVQWVAP